VLHHITSRSDWDRRRENYLPPDFEGFVHCSTADQVVPVADAIFRGRDDLVLLVIDPGKLTAEVVWEDCYEAGEEYPHIYGPVDTEAVAAVVDFPCSDDGSFRLPAIEA
jgi:uncharacterized protein (DUF952 family)